MIYLFDILLNDMHVHIHKSCLPPSPRCAYRIGFEELLESFVRSTISRATGIPVSPSNGPDTQYSLDRTFRDHFILGGKKKKTKFVRISRHVRHSSIGVRSNIRAFNKTKEKRLLKSRSLTKFERFHRFLARSVPVLPTRRDGHSD